jgi:triosephosphate isomerase
VTRTIVAGNWKMHKTVAQTRAYFETFQALAAAFPPEIEVVIAPPFTALTAASEAIAGIGLRLGAQTMHWRLEGPYTGEISAPMLLELGVSYVILGHSERRAYCNETDSSVNRKVLTALAQGLTPIVAVGETDEERSAGLTDERIVSQTLEALKGVAHADFARLAIAYEPIWAIGSGRNCDPAEADRVMAAIRGCMKGLEETPILYGGSMNAENVAAYMERPNVNGGLVGGASLDPTGFAALVRNAAR